MNLQVCCPYKKCPFGCPTCIAATDYKYPYGDIYFADKERYLDILRSTIGKYDTIFLIDEISYIDGIDAKCIIDDIVGVLYYALYFCSQHSLRIKNRINAFEEYLLRFYEAK